MLDQRFINSTPPMSDCAIEGFYQLPLDDAGGDHSRADMTHRNLWWEGDIPSEPMAPHTFWPGRVITDDRGVCWTVVELHAASAAAESAGSLAFLSAHNVRQVWTYPARWRALRGADLKAIGWPATTLA